MTTNNALSRLRFAIPVAALALAACGSGAPVASDSSTIPHPKGGADIVVRVELIGGFLGPADHFRRIPTFTLYGDGRIITEGPQIEIFPPPALPNVLQRSITEDGVQAILRAARDHGLLGADKHYRNPGVVDAPSTVFTVNSNGRHVIKADALGLGDEPGAGPGAGVSEDDAAAMRRLSAFQRMVTDLGSWLPAGALGEEKAYDAKGVRVLVQPYDNTVAQDLPQQPTAWPLAVPLSTFGKEQNLGRCGVVVGDNAERLLEKAQQTNTLTPWTSGDKPFLLTFRPLLPDERDC